MVINKKNRNKPFLKWAGNKFRYINIILPHLPPASRLIEPFTGTGALFLNTDYPNYLLAEANKDLVELFQYVQREGLEFIDYCAQFFIGSHNVKHDYYKLREDFNTTKDLRYKAALFLYLNKHGYNGLCRYNHQGSYNVPFGSYDKPYFPRQEMINFFNKSVCAQFINNDFRQTFALAKSGDIIYCDPPYIPLSPTANFSSYINKTFTNEDQQELAILAQLKAEQGIPVIISNHDTELSRYYYRHSQIISFRVQRFISCNGGKRQEVPEILAIFKEN